jgi:prepilin-type N-terminal cleavage/methylation domain-containing protein
MRKKGFTLVELLVVIAIIAMLLAILMPALAKVKTLAYQMLCGTNLKGIANATLVYTQDNNEKYPVAGLAGVLWNNVANINPAGRIPQGWNWDDPAKPSITGTNQTTNNFAAANNMATVSACLYLLVKYADVSPSSFVCKASKQKKFNIAVSQADASEKSAVAAGAANQGKDATDCWDFSNVPSRYCSYAYAYPWDSAKLLSSASKAGVAIAGDLNPWIQIDPADSTKVKFATPATGTDSPQLILAATAGKTTWATGNSLTHELAGQSILFNDMHVEFCKQPQPDSTIQNDNVYTPFESTLADPARRGKGHQPANTGNTDVLQRPQSK